MTNSHRLAILVLEQQIQTNDTTKWRCIAYNDPQNEIDRYDEMNEDLMFTVDFLKNLNIKESNGKHRA